MSLPTTTQVCDDFFRVNLCMQSARMIVRMHANLIYFM